MGTHSICFCGEETFPIDKHAFSEAMNETTHIQFSHGNQTYIAASDNIALISILYQIIHWCHVS